MKQKNLKGSIIMTKRNLQVVITERNASTKSETASRNQVTIKKAEKAHGTKIHRNLFKAVAIAVSLMSACPSASAAQKPARQAATTKDVSPELLELFPDSQAPNWYKVPSVFAIDKTIRTAKRACNWHPELDEMTVFHALLRHEATEERSYDFGIGKGGQLYSIYSSFGEAMPPSSPISQWNDETWQFTANYWDVHTSSATPERVGDAFVHQSGIYTRGDLKPFYSPRLATGSDLKRRSYSLLNWGQIPRASINRSGVLIYVQYRDLGGGALEITYVIYNFEKYPMGNLGPWGGVRTTVFPEHVLSRPDGSYRFYDDPRRVPIAMKDTGGWAAAVYNAANPYSYAIACVFGRDLDRDKEHEFKGAPFYQMGDTQTAERNYTVQALGVRPKDKPGTVHLLRMYLVLGTLQEVANKANKLAPYADYQQLVFTQKDTPVIPLYEIKHRGVGPAILTKNKPAETGGTAKCKVYKFPVNGSMPLFVVKETESGRHFLTTDPYAKCDQLPYENPFRPGHEMYERYQDRTLYTAYGGKTDWIELLGFVMPQAKADQSADHIKLSSVLADEASFFAGEKFCADDLMVRK